MTYYGKEYMMNKYRGFLHGSKLAKLNKKYFYSKTNW